MLAETVLFKNRDLSSLIDCYVYDWNGDELAGNNRIRTLKCLGCHPKLKFTKAALDKAIEKGYLEVVKYLASNRSEGYTIKEKVFEVPEITKKNVDMYNFLEKRKLEEMFSAVTTLISSLQHNNKGEFLIRRITQLLQREANLGPGTRSSYYNSPNLLFFKYFPNDREMVYSDVKFGAIKQECYQCLKELEKESFKSEKFYIVNGEKYGLLERHDVVARRLMNIFIVSKGDQASFYFCERGEYCPSGGIRPSIRNFCSHRELTFADVKSLLND